MHAEPSRELLSDSSDQGLADMQCCADAELTDETLPLTLAEDPPETRPLHGPWLTDPYRIANCLLLVIMYIQVPHTYNCPLMGVSCLFLTLQSMRWSGMKV